jgi:hypothetical protein
METWVLLFPPALRPAFASTEMSTLTIGSSFVTTIVPLASDVSAGGGVGGGLVAIDASPPITNTSRTATRRRRSRGAGRSIMRLDVVPGSDPRHRRQSL